MGIDAVSSSAPPTFDVAQVIDSPKVGAYRFMVIGICFLIAMMDGFDTLALALAAPSISQDWNIPPDSFGPLMAVGLLGSVIGAAAAGSIGDRIGRKNALLVSVAIFGILTFACGLARGYEQLFFIRLLAGIGLGGALPNFLALASEFSASRWRTTAVTIVTWGFPLGAIFGGLLVPPVLEAYSWHMIFFGGGALPLLLLPLFYMILPESIRFMIVTRQDRSRITRTLQRISQSIALPSDADYILTGASTGGSGLKAVFAPAIRWTTAFLSSAQFFYQLTYYLLASWIPMLLHMAGMSVRESVLGTVALNVGGVLGSLLFSRLVDRLSSPLLIIMAGYLLGGGCIAVISLVGNAFTELAVALFVTGFCLTGAGLCLTAYVPSFYPTSIRSSGVGVIQALGRFGSLIGPLIGGLMLSAGLSPHQLFQVSALIPVMSSLSILALIIIGAAEHVRKNA